MRWILVVWFGDTAPVRKAKDLALVVLPLFLADVVTKCLALAFLKERNVSLLSGGLNLYLAINESLFSHGRTPTKAGFSGGMAFWAAMSMGLAAVACFPFARAQWSVPRKLLLMVTVLLGGATAGYLLGLRLEWEPHRLVLHAMRAFSAMAILLLGLRLTRSRVLGLAVGLALAGTLGNTLNVVYYPRGIIDFVYIPLFSPYLGVFNLADVTLEAAKGLVLLSPLVLVLCRRVERLAYVNPTQPTTP